MPFDYKFMPGNIVRAIDDHRFSNLTILNVVRPHDPGMGGFWITAGRISKESGHTVPVLSGVDWQFELDPDREQTDVPYYKVTQKRHAPPFYWPNLYVSIEDAKTFIRDLAIRPYLEPLRSDYPTSLHIVDAYDWVLETYYLVKKYSVETHDPGYGPNLKALFQYLAHIGDKED